MIQFLTSKNEVQVCMGAGCKAWRSDKISREIEGLAEELGMNELKVCQVPCFKKCGGGASLKFGSRDGIKKFKSSEEALDFLFSDRLAPVAV